jgi:hypothetical protein
MMGDRFVLSALGSPFHLGAWKISIDNISGYQQRYRLRLRATAYAAFLPSSSLRNLLIGKVLISVL